MNWQEFAQREPELAALGRERLGRNGLVMVGTLRKNGWPRISPVEPLFANGQLYLGMMWRSQKALDLLRDPRCTIHNAVSDRQASEGEFKIYGRAFDITNPGERQEYVKTLFEKVGFQPEDREFHCFAIDIQSAAASTLVGDELQHQVWRAK
ncbi:MAG: pyridoxamine 5'-phosphate oxidase family protein [Chloroflexi bacterium]|nr:pyridoxamine 5'-phosphate oxidase family protein [Chloroflexota bacterium]